MATPAEDPPPDEGPGGPGDGPGRSRSGTARGTARRFPATVYGSGADPDPRFSLANERTYLAWIRTSLALLATGIALEALQLPMPAGLRVATAGLFVALSVVAAAQSWLGWVRTEIAMRHGRALPGPTLGGIVTAGVMLGAAAVGVGLLLELA